MALRVFAAVLATYVATLAAAAPADCTVNPALHPVECCSAPAPPAFNVTLGTTVGGNITIHVNRSWDPLGAARFYNMARCHYLDDSSFFRVIPDFVVQFGIAAAPNVSAAWQNLVIANDPPSPLSNVRGTVAYAADQDASGQACNRTTQVFVNYGNNSRLDALGFTVFGVVVGQGMAVADNIFAGYRQQPDQGMIYKEGNAYLTRTFPGLSYMTTTSLAE